MRKLSTAFRLTATALSLLAAAQAAGQATFPAVFVSNNGNLEGSVTSFRVNCDGTLTFVDRYITGSRPSSSDYHPGTNAYSISLSPSGRYLVSAHTTSSETVERLTVMAVGSDGTLSLIATYETPDSPLDVQWLSDEYLAATRTSLSVTNEVIVYHFDPEGPLTEIDREPTGSFTTWLALHPSGEYLYAQDSTGRKITGFRINADGTLDYVNEVFTSVYPLGIGVSADGTKIYGGGGISADRHAVPGCHIDPATGELSLMLGSPFYSPGNSPKQVVISDDNALAFVAHGTDATMRSFWIDEESGALTPTGYLFDVGTQGSLGTMATMRDLVFVTDNWDGPTGVYSFTIQPDGTLAQNGTLVSTQGIAPLSADAWDPGPGPCPGDVNGDLAVSFDDLVGVLAAYGSCQGDAGFNPAADINYNCCVEFDDLLIVLGEYGDICR